MTDALSLFSFSNQVEPLESEESGLFEQGLVSSTALHHACFFSFSSVSLDRMRELLESGLDPNACDGMGLTPLHHLVLSRKVTFKTMTFKKAELLLEYGADPHLEDNAGFTPFRYAVGVGNLFLVPFFVSRGIGIGDLEKGEIDRLDEEGLSFFHRACLAGEVSVVQSFLDNGASLEVKSGEGLTPLELASKEKNRELVELFLDKELEPSAGKGLTLHRAAGKGQQFLLELLLSRGQAIDLRDERGWTALHCAVDQERREVVRFLLSQGADLLIQNDLGQTPFGLAVKRGDLELAFLLEEREGEFFRGEASLQEALSRVLERRDEPWLLKLLDLMLGEFEEGGEDVDVAERQKMCQEIFQVADTLTGRLNEKGEKIWYPLARWTEPHLLKFFFYLGVDLDSQNTKGQSVFHLVCSESPCDVRKVRFLLDSGADPNLRDKRGVTPSLNLVRGGGMDFEAFKVILRAGGDPSLKDREGRSPLQFLVRRSEADLEIFEEMLRAGGDPNVDSNSFRALRLSWSYLTCQSAEESLASYRLWRELYLCGRDPGHRQDFSCTGMRCHAGMQELQFICSTGEGAQLGLSLPPLELLLDRGADPNFQDDKGWTALHWLAYRADRESSLERMRFLLERGAEPNLLTGEGQSFYDLLDAKRALGSRYLDYVELLYDFGLEDLLSPAKDPFVGEEERSYLRRQVAKATASGSPKALSGFIEYVDSRPEAFGKPLESPDGKHPVEYLIEKKRFDRDKIVEQLLGASLYFRGEEKGEPLLHTAVRRNDTQLIRYLAYLGGELDQQDERGQTALHIADRSEIVDFLLKLGADPNLQDQDGNSPYHLSLLRAADSAGYVPAYLMMKFGANLHLKNHEGYLGSDLCSLNWSSRWSELTASRHCYANFLAKLYQAGLDPDRPLLLHPDEAKALTGRSEVKEIKPILYSYLPQVGSSDLLEALLDKGVDFKVKDERGVTPLHMVAKWSDFYPHTFEMIREMCEKGADPNAQDLEGLTPSHYLIRHASLRGPVHLIRVMKTLLEYGGQRIAGSTNFSALLPWEYLRRRVGERSWVVIRPWERELLENFLEELDRKAGL